MRLLPLLLFSCSVMSSLASAQETASTEQSLNELRSSLPYQEGMEDLLTKIEFAYDWGAVHGFSHWDAIHDYFMEIARSRGCKTGAAYAKARMQACHEVSKPQPKFLSTQHKKGRAKVATFSRHPPYPEFFKRSLFFIYDHGYAQGMKHGLLSHYGDMPWAEGYFASCMERANDAKHEPACAAAAKAWAKPILKKLSRQIEAQSMAGGTKP